MSEIFAIYLLLVGWLVGTVDRSVGLFAPPTEACQKRKQWFHNVPCSFLIYNKSKTFQLTGIAR